jgi:hypothetical protein
VLVVRRDARLKVLNAELASDGFCRARIVAGEHEHLHAELAQFRQRFRCRGFHGIGDGQDSRRTARDGDQYRGCSFGLIWGGQ